MKVGIIGAGITGLTAAYELSKRNIEVTLFEKSAEVGGIAGTFEYGDFTLEKYYHHFFKSDQYIYELTKELGILKEILWLQSKMGFFVDNTLFDFGTPISLLKIKSLTFIDKIKFGITIMKILSINNYKELEKVTAHDWLQKNAGHNVYDKVWKPLLVTKFGDQYRDISMAWFWGKIKLRGTSKEKGVEVLGYINGSTKKLLDGLEKKLKVKGVNIVLSSEVKSITKRDGFIIETTSDYSMFDRVISTVPLPIFIEMARPMLSEEYIKQKQDIKYTSTVCMVLMLDRPFTGYYWLNIGDEGIPFGGLIEHTNLIGREFYGNNNILYISNYLYKDSKYYKMGADELLHEYIPYLKKINPRFSIDWVRDVHLFKDEYAQPIVKTHYSKILPDFETGVDGLYTASMCNIYPEDRGMNYAIRDGIKVSKLIAN